ncbi:MAG: metalloprotease PmbA [Gammaproteobacteria bacterium]|nr:metalloprotease PmbA [Gammaproteobacteria bacterium]
MSESWNLKPGNQTENTLLDVTELALEIAKSFGATMAEMSIGKGQGMSVTVRNGDVETVERNRDKSLAISVYFGHRNGTATTTDFSRSAIESSVRSACNIAKYTEEDEYNGLADVELLATEFPDLDLYHPWELEMEEAIDMALRCESAAFSSDSRVSNTEGASISSHTGIDLYANSHGFRGLSRSSRHSVGCSLIGGEGNDMQRDYWYDSKRDAKDLLTVESVGKEAANRTLRRLGARKIKTGKYPVIYEPSIASSLLGHLVSAISGSSLYRKASFLLDQKGEQIFPDNVRIHEQPHILKASGSSAFDSEGIATSPRDIVNNGVLEDYVLSSYSARKLGLVSTANAGGTHNLTIDSTDGGLDELIRSMGRGLVVSELIGFGVNTVTGDYSRGAFGFWVENGEIQYPVQEFTIAGNLTDMFRGFAAIGSDVDLRGSTRTGSILIDNMTVAGE